MLFCEECGTPYEVGSAFCQECGTRLEQTISFTEQPLRRKSAFLWRAIGISGVALLAVLAVILTISVLNPHPSPTRLLPDNALLYAEVTDVPGLIKEVDQFLQEVSLASGRDLKMELKLKAQGRHPDDLLSILSQVRSLHLCVVDFTVPALAGGLDSLLLRGQDVEAWLPSMILLVDFGSKGTIAEQFEEQLLPQLKAQLPPEIQLFRSEFQGHPLYELAILLQPPSGLGSSSAQGLSLFATVSHGYVLLSPQRRLLEALLDDSRKDKRALEDDPLFVKTQAYRPRKGVLAYLNVTPMWPKLEGLLSWIPGPANPRARRLLEEIRPQDIKTLSLTFDPSGNVMKLTGYVQVDPANPLVRIVRQPSQGWQDQLEAIPEGVHHFTAFASDDPVRTWQEAISLGLRIERAMGEDALRSELSQIGSSLRRIGIDFEKDLIAYLGHAPTILHWAGGFGFLLKQEDSSQTQSHLQNLENALQQLPGVRIETKQAYGLTVKSLHVQGRAEVAYTFWHNYLLICNPPEFERAVQDLVNQKDLRKNSEVEALFSALPSTSAIATLSNLTAESRDTPPLYVASSAAWEADGIATYMVMSRKGIIKAIAGYTEAEKASLPKRSVTTKKEPLRDSMDQTRVNTTKAQIEMIGTALDTFRLDVGRYPTTQEGLEALRQRPPGVDRWDGPYLKKDIPKDGWGNPFIYRSPGEREPYELLSYGADRTAGGTGDNADIKSWEG